MRIFGSLLLLSVLGAMFLGLFHMAAGKDMAGHHASCPFMAHDEVLCDMTVGEHLGAWKATFTFDTPLYVLLVAGAAVLTVVWPLVSRRHRSHSSPYRTRFLWLRERCYSYVYRPLQDLFSCGILHPKRF